MININALIIHELEKEPETHEASLYLTESPVPIDDRAEALLLKLDNAFLGREEVLQAYLSSPEDALFPGYFQTMLDEGMGSEAFLDFSHQTMKALQEEIKGVAGAKGGYLVYIDYEWMESHLLGIFLVRNTEGLIFRKQEDKTAFTLDPITYLNTEKLAMACRININRYQKGDNRCVELVKYAKSQKAISEYFLNWIGLDRPEGSKALTHTFLEVVDQLPLPKDENSGEPIKETEFREQVMQFAMRSPEKTMSIERFDHHFYPEKPVTQAFLQENNIPLDREFRFDTGTMKKYFNFRVSAEGISIAFTRNDLNVQKVSIEDDVIVIRSEALMDKLLELLD